MPGELFIMGREGLASAPAIMLGFASFDLGDLLYQISAAAFVLLLGVLAVVLIGGAGYILYYLFSLPRRRLERAMVFLNLVDAGIRRGVTPEETIKQAAACGDDSLSVRFQLVAAWVLQGVTWREALLKVPRLLPPSIMEMLFLADRAGGWSKILPICQRKLTDVLSQLRARQSCFSPSIVILPLPMIFITATLMRVVIPKYHAIAADYDAEFSSFLDWLVRVPFPVLPWLILLGLLPLAVLFLHITGPRLWSVRTVTGTIGDRLEWSMPWQRMRLKRDFAALLGLLLDANVPEGEAVELAARGTANAILQGKAAEVKQAVAMGQPLPEALGRMDAAGEFQWRFQQAASGGTRFETALAGWCDALQARADQLQQTVMHIGSVVLLLINASFVGLITFDVFRILINITEKALE